MQGYSTYETNLYSAEKEADLLFAGCPCSDDGLWDRNISLTGMESKFSYYNVALG